MSIGAGRIQVVTKIRIKGGTKVRTKVTFLNRSNNPTTRGRNGGRFQG